MRVGRYLLLAVASTICLGAFVGVDAAPRELGFEDRVRAQEALERVYYSHQVGATTPFEDAVPKALLERKVRTYLKETAALEEFWKTSVSDEMLQKELQRMAGQTRMPDRLQELYAALGGNPFLIRECLARPMLVDRLARNFFAFDQTLHRESRDAAERLRRDLIAGSRESSPTQPGAQVVEVVRETPAPSNKGSSPGLRVQPEPLRLASGEFDSWVDRLPASPGKVGPVEEDRGQFIIRRVLERDSDHARVATYAVRKRAWEDWWSAVSPGLEERIPAAAVSHAESLPLPRPASSPTCLPDQTWDNGSLDGYFTGRSWHTAVWTGSLMLIFGGNFMDGSAAGRTALRYDPATDTWSPASIVNAPTSRAAHTAVWTGSVMVIWGGYEGPEVATGGRYDPVSDTWSSTSMTDAPEGRQVHTAVWTGSRMIVWGGWNGSIVLDSGASYDPVNDVWSPISSTNAPSAREFHAAVWTGTRMVIWGGDSDEYPPYFDTGGRYDPSTDSWAATSTFNAPEPRSFHIGVWTGHQMLIWGGYGNVDFLNSGARYDPEADTWQPMTPANAPSRRSRAQAVWAGASMIVMGGFNDIELPVTGGRYDPVSDSWSPTSIVNAPTGRYMHSMIWTGTQMILWGGDVNSDSFGEGLRTGGRYDPNNDSWTPIALPYRPDSVGGHTAVWTGNEMIDWGDRGFLFPGAAGARYNPIVDAWTSTSTVNAPSNRTEQTAVWSGNQMLIWGGRAEQAPYVLGDGARYDPIADTWASISTTGAPAPRTGHGAAWTGMRMVVWGGLSTSGFLNSGSRYDPVTDTWSLTTPTNAPAPRWAASMTWTGTRVLVWGGYNGTTYLNSGSSYDPVANTWAPISTINAPSPRSNAYSVWTGAKMLVWGGLGSTMVALSAGGAYDPSSGVWTTISSVNAPQQGTGVTVVWTGTKMILWGGATGGGVSAGGIYDPWGDAWQTISTINVPSPRYHHVAVWTGRFMIIWGGDLINSSALPTGGRFAYGLLSDFDQDGFTVCDGDCDDGRAMVHPGAAESCNGLDDDCDGTVDNGGNTLCADADACTTDLCGGFAACLHPLRDGDGDGFADLQCGGTDCADADPLVHPGAPEQCNGLDDNCDSVVDDGGAALCNDQNVCTLDACGGVTGCHHAPHDADADGRPDASCGGSDCDDSNPQVWSPPPEATGLAIGGAVPTGLSWDDQGPQVGTETIYALVTGVISASGSSGFASASCLLFDAPTTFNDGRPDPPVGSAFWYLVRGLNTCGSGTYGTSQRDAEINTCF